MRQEQVRAMLTDPVAQELLGSAIPARFSYIGLDGDPRVIPIGFLWTGERFVICTVPRAAKVRALAANPKVALTIDTNDFPPHVLLVRRTATVEVVPGVPQEYLDASARFVGAAGMADFEAQVRGLYDSMARIEVEPQWAKVMDFTGPDRMPRAVAELVTG